MCVIIMKHIIFLIIAMFEKYSYRLKNRYYQFYNLRYLKRKGAKIGNNCMMTGKNAFSLSQGSTLEIGDNFICRSGFRGHILGAECSSFHIWGGKLKIGANSGISATNINCSEFISIGSHVLIGAGCLITDSNHHSINWKQRCMEGDCNIKTAPIVIEDYVFVGAKSIILKGVTIGEKSVIAAGSVVVDDIPANCIAGGNPCKVIKYLN